MSKSSLLLAEALSGDIVRRTDLPGTCGISLAATTLPELLIVDRAAEEVLVINHYDLTERARIHIGPGVIAVKQWGDHALAVWPPGGKLVVLKGDRVVGRIPVRGLGGFLDMVISAAGDHAIVAFRDRPLMGMNLTPPYSTWDLQVSLEEGSLFLDSRDRYLALWGLASVTLYRLGRNWRRLRQVDQFPASSQESAVGGFAFSPTSEAYVYADRSLFTMGNRQDHG